MTNDKWQMTNDKWQMTNDKWQMTNDISKFQIPNTNFDADKWQTRMTFTRISNSTEYATCRVKNYNIRDFKDTLGFWGYEGFCFRILFQDTISGFCFMFEYTRNILFDLFSNIVTGRWLLLTVSWLGLKLESYGSISLWNSAFWNSAFWNSAF